MFRIICAFALLTGLNLPVWAEDIHPYDSHTIFGQAIWIGEDKARFPALYAEAAAPEAKGVIIMLHAEGEHPQWPMVIQVLREQLTAHGWNTLALQLPTPIASARTLDRKAYTEMASEKLQMAVNHVMPMNPPVMVLLGHGLGANAVIKRATEHLDNNLMAVIGVSINATVDQTDALNTLEHIRQLKLPVLDVYAERDRFEVRQSSRDRKRASLKAGNKDYRQLKIPGASQHFYNHTDMLGSRVKSWLDATYRKLPDEKTAPENRLEAFPMTMPAISSSPKDTKAAAADAQDQKTKNVAEQVTPEETAASTSAEESVPANRADQQVPNPTGPEGLF